MQRLIATLTFGVLAFAHLAQAVTPQLVSLSPSSGRGQTQTFTLTASDSAGSSDIASMNLLINSSFNGQGACWLYYDHKNNQLKIATDVVGGGGAVWSDNVLVPGESLSESNAQCSVSFLSAKDSGNNVSISVSITFSGAWLGQRTIWAAAQDIAHDDTGYQQMGTFTAVNNGPVQDFTVSITPSSPQTTTPGNSVSYNVVLTSVNGFSGPVYLATSVNPNPGGLNIAEKVSGFSYNVPANGTSNRTILVQTSSTTTPANVTISFSYQDDNLQHVVPVTLDILPTTAPVPAITPTSGSESTQTFTITATDPGGYGAIQGVNILFNSSFSGTNACWLYFQQSPSSPAQGAQGTLFLASDDTTSWANKTDVSEGSNTAGSIHNNQCSVFGGPTTVSGSGNTLTLTITLTFTPSFAGLKLVYVRANDVAGPDSTYQQLGTFTAVGASTAPDFEVGVSPGSESIDGQGESLYFVYVNGYNGYAGTVSFSVTGLPPNSTLVPPASIGAAQNAEWGVKTTGATPTGVYTLTITGTDGTLTHSTTTLLNVAGASMPALTVSPNSGTGASQTFTFIAQGQGGTTNPTYLNVLINNTVNGQGACWLYYNVGLQLASDDGSIWQSFGGNPSISNSQCTISSVQSVGPANSLGFGATITFSGSFTGAKNIFMHSTDDQGGDTGYQLKGSWTVP